VVKKILIKRSSEPGEVPALEDLETGEIAINTNDCRLFMRTPDLEDDEVNEYIQSLPNNFDMDEQSSILGMEILNLSEKVHKVSVIKEEGDN
jgi:hypothetical protein